MTPSDVIAILQTSLKRSLAGAVIDDDSTEIARIQIVLLLVTRLDYNSIEDILQEMFIEAQ